MTKFNVLHADDVAQWRLYVDDALKDKCVVESVESGDDVLPRLEQGGVDLVILDLLMPSDKDETGYEVLENIKSKYPSLPIVMFTGATSGTPTTREQLEADWKVPVVFKAGSDAGSQLSEQVMNLLDN